MGLLVEKRPESVILGTGLYPPFFMPDSAQNELFLKMELKGHDHD
jgi:hypothetical protein